MAGSPDKPLRLLTYNIQVGLHTRDYGHMVSGAWRHVWPSRSQSGNLERIAELLSEYDFVAIQEADAGSLRTRDCNQIEFLAELETQMLKAADALEFESAAALRDQIKQVQDAPLLGKPEHRPSAPKPGAPGHRPQKKRRYKTKS